MLPFTKFEEVIKKFYQIRNATLLLLFGIFLCFCVAGFLTFVSFVILFVLVPFCFFIGIPLQVAVLVLSWVVRPLLQHTLPPTAPALPKTEQQKSSLVLKSEDPDLVVSNSPWRTPLRSAFGLNNTPSPFLYARPLPPIHSDTLDQISTPLIISVPIEEASPNVLGLNFVESPTGYNIGENPFPRRNYNYFEKLSDKIIDQILSYLPCSSIGILALVSKDLASRFRFRRVHSGTEYYPLSTFSEISKRPRLGQNTRRLVIHKTFYRPLIKTQWLLEGSNANVVQTSWKTTEMKRHGLLAAVLQSCRQISSLTWNEARLSLPLTLLKTLEIRLNTTLRHLDISAKHNQLIKYTNRHRDHLSQTFHLISIIIRDGFSLESVDAIAKFIRFSQATIRQIHFKDSNFGSVCTQDKPAILELLRELPCLERVDFTRPVDLVMPCIPIAHAGIKRGLTLNIQDPTTTHTPYIRFELSFPLGHVLHNLTTMILYLPNHINTLDIDHDTQLSSPHESPDSPRSGHNRTLADAVSAAVNLRVFALNAPVPTVHGPTDEDSTRSSSIIKLTSDLLEVLITRKKLVSLSLMARVITPHQIQRICENLRTLSHLAVFMSGESIHISKYSQHFAKLSNLMALDVAIRSFDQTCPCGHELDPRFPHHEEGTAMGRLCRRFLPRIDMNGQKIPSSDTNKHLKLVRLSRLGWHYNNEEHEQIMHEISWLSSLPELVDQVERMWGPCEVSLLSPSHPRRATMSSSSLSSFEMAGAGGQAVVAPALARYDSSDLWMRLEKEAVRKMFSPVSWTDFAPDSVPVLDVSGGTDVEIMAV